MKEVMWFKEDVEAILSIMGSPLEDEYIATPWGHSLRACVMIDFIEELPLQILITTTKGF